jgi:hypothetical protein
VGRGQGGSGQKVPIGEVHDAGEIELGPPLLGGGAAAGSGAAVWAAAGGVADRRLGRIVGSSGRRCVPLRGQQRAALRAATRTASGGAAGCLLDSNGGGGSCCGVRRGHSVQGIRLRVNIEKNH